MKLTVFQDLENFIFSDHLVLDRFNFEKLRLFHSEACVRNVDGFLIFCQAIPRNRLSKLHLSQFQISFITVPSFSNNDSNKSVLSMCLRKLACSVSVMTTKEFKLGGQTFFLTKYGYLNLAKVREEQIKVKDLRIKK